MADGALLDDLTGFEFEDVMADVYRKLGYENVRVAEQVADLGRDVIMEEVVDGTRQVVIVECKHTDTVSRPVLQKLHSAVATYEFDGPRRGMVATTGRFTGPAAEYASDLRAADDPYPIELIDGTDLRSIADEVGLDLYNGRIEILCEETLRPIDPTAGVDGPLRSTFRDVENLTMADLPTPTSVVDFRPVVLILASIEAVFETSVGVVHTVNERDGMVIDATRGTPASMDESVYRLVAEGHKQTKQLDEDEFSDLFDDVTVTRFGRTETEYKDWARDEFRDRHTTTVRYTGDNNVTYTKTCEPTLSDVSIQSITPVYLPEVEHTVDLLEYSYSFNYYASGPSRVTKQDGVHRCVHCNTSGRDTTYTYCDNCGSINCPTHTETERLEERPICTGCAVTDAFFFKTKYFYDEENLERFRAEYEAMPIYEKAQENVPLLVGAIVLATLGIVAALSATGIV